MKDATGLIPYAICFCRSGDRVLMLYRNGPPNAGLWNGLGGRIEPGETPLDCVRREVMEEVGIEPRPDELRFAGVVRWPAGVDPTGPSTGMHASVAELGDHRHLWDGTRDTFEGTLAWKPVPWVCDPKNNTVVSNVLRFLPGLFREDERIGYWYEYAGEELLDVVERPLQRPGSWPSV